MIYEKLENIRKTLPDEIHKHKEWDRKYLQEEQELSKEQQKKVTIN
jgi:hypothetical protein